MKVLFVASECAPIAKVGGLGDIIGSLPKTLKKLGVDVSIVLPFYDVVQLEKKNSIRNFVSNGVNFWQTTLPESEVPLFLIENKSRTFSRSIRPRQKNCISAFDNPAASNGVFKKVRDKDYFKGNVYLEADASSSGSEEEAKRFLFLSLSAIKGAKLLKPDILHCHDWHVGMVPFLTKKEKLPIKTILTIHNLGYQGIYSSRVVNKLLGTDFSGEVNCLKQGILSADFINTVSPNYAKEILTPEYGCGLEKELQKRKNELVGILNGLDEEQFNPEKDSYIKEKYSVNNLDKKLNNKILLQKNCFGKIAPEVPVLGMVSRLAQQKGFDLIKTIFCELMKENLQFIILGKGIKEYEDFFQEKSQQYPKKFLVRTEFNEELAHQIYAGSDIFLMPSLFEPCGLGQMISMKYGTVPLVRATGGLKDTVTKKTGFSFEKYEPQEFLKTIKEALTTFQNKKTWRELQINGMKQDFSWQNSAQKYLKIYRGLTRV